MSSLSIPILLVVNSLANPMGVHDPAPRLGWQMSPVEGRRGLAQSAYEIRVSARPGGPADLWDSGRVAGDASTQVPYQGPALASRTRAYWRVSVWDDKGEESSSAGDAFWETGLLSRSDWSGQWIGASWHGAGQTGANAPYLRREFSLGRRPVGARLYVTALGLYEAYINGTRVGDASFTPGWTDYRKRVQYQVYDVTSLVGQGDNVVGAVLGDGWYAGHVAYRAREIYGDRPKFLAQLEVTYGDGSRETIATDGSWAAAPGPILENDLLMGETYDARSELDGWQRPGAARGDWQPVRIFPDPGIEISPVLGPPVRTEVLLRPVGPPRAADAHRYIYDFGQNLVGVASLSVKAPAGTSVSMRFAEVLDASGSLYTENLRSARATDVYTCRGAKDGETWTPRFTYHGFRYVEVSGLPEGSAPGPDALVARVLHSDAAPAGDFACSNPLINQLQRNIQWSQRGNYFEVPTDCPQRDERLGWMGDAQAFIRTGAWNRDVEGFFTKWQRDIGDAQAADGSEPWVCPKIELTMQDGGPAWSDAAVICPWTVYLCYGDRDILARHFTELERYVAFTGTQCLGDIRLHPSLGKWAGFGDWLALDGSGHIDGGTPKDLIATAYYAQDLKILSSMARVLGNPEAAQKYQELAERVTRAFQRRFITADGLVAGNTQTCYVLALDFDLAPPELRPKLADELVRDIRGRGNKLSTGFVGTPRLLHVLAREGHLDVAYDLLLQKDWPSWLYPVTQGATTIWERWDGWTRDKGFEDKGMNSFNHYAYGAVGDWLYRVVAGIEIDPLSPGYRHFLLQPRPGPALSWAGARHQSPYGEIESAWKIADGSFSWEIVVPPGTTATVRFPPEATAGLGEGGGPLAASPGISKVRQEGGVTLCEAASGDYRFSAAWAGKVP